MRSRWTFGVGLGLCAFAVFTWWLWSREPEPSIPPTSDSARAGEPTPPRTPPDVPSEPRTAPPMGAGPAAEPGVHGDLERAPTGDLRRYAERPMSAVPHRVARAWGVTDDPQQLGVVGAYVVVKPGTSNQELTKLCRDILEYHRDAKVLGVRILDSDDAASYARDADGGALADDHLVARVSRDATLGVESCLVRGALVKP